MSILSQYMANRQREAARDAQWSRDHNTLALNSPRLQARISDSEDEARRERVAREIAAMNAAERAAFFEPPRRSR